MGLGSAFNEHWEWNLALILDYNIASQYLEAGANICKHYRELPITAKALRVGCWEGLCFSFEYSGVTTAGIIKTLYEARVSEPKPPF